MLNSMSFCGVLSCIGWPACYNEEEGGSGHKTPEKRDRSGKIWNVLKSPFQGIEANGFNGGNSNNVGR